MARSEAPALAKAVGNSYPLRLPPPRQSSTLHEALWGNQMAYGTGSHQMYGAGDRVDAEVGYGLPLGARFVGTPRVGLTTSPYGRDCRFGYGLGALEQGKVSFELGVDAQRRETPMGGGASNGLLGRASLGW